MQAWQQRLYEAYVSSGQAAAVPARTASAADYPYLVDVVSRHVPADPNLRILDLGCGHGSLVLCLRTAGFERVRGVDVSEEQVAMARHLGIDGVSQGELLDELKASPHSVDVIFLMDVLEHLEPGQVLDVLKFAREALADGGRLIMHVPNAGGLFGMRIRYGDFTHLNCFTEQSINQVLRASGFDSVTVFEDAPLKAGAKGMFRYYAWQILMLPPRLALYLETGVKRHVLSQNLLAVARA